jgi:hypothetical protein
MQRNLYDLFILNVYSTSKEIFRQGFSAWPRNRQQILEKTVMAMMLDPPDELYTLIKP